MLSPQHIVWIRIRPILGLAGFVFLVKYSLDFNSANPVHFTCLKPPKQALDWWDSLDVRITSVSPDL